MFAMLGAKLLALPLIGRVFGWGKNTAVPYVKDNGRLILGNFLIVVVIAVGTLSVTLWFQREKLEKKLSVAHTRIDTLQDKVIAVEQVNAAQQDTINNLENLRVVDARALTGLHEDYKRLNSRDDTLKRQLSELEKNNASVREYLDRPLPPELRELLASGQTETRTGNSSRR